MKLGTIGSFLDWFAAFPSRRSSFYATKRFALGCHDYLFAVMIVGRGKKKVTRSALQKIAMQPCTIRPHIREKTRGIRFIAVAGPLSYLSAHNPSFVSAESATAELKIQPEISKERN